MKKLHLFLVITILGTVFSQEDEGQFDEIEDEVANILTTTTEEPLRLENQAGPTEFYFQNMNLPKFKMSVESGIELTLYKEGIELDKFIFDKRASGGITGSRQQNRLEDDLESDEKKIIRDDFTVNIYWKEPLTGINGRRVLNQGFGLEFKFERKGNSWKMNELTVRDVQYESNAYAVEHLAMGAKTIGGHAVEAPVGLSYGCYEGTFRSNTTMPTVGKIHFPGWRIQVFEVKRGKFGPMWECGELMSIGLWVGLLVTLGFALICAWGFSMLASINTMDRFDDPKGKTIHIPQTSD